MEGLGRSFERLNCRGRTTGTLAEQQSAFSLLGDLKSDAADAIVSEWLDKRMKRDVANDVMLYLADAAAKREAGAVKTRLATCNDWKLPKDRLTPHREDLSMYFLDLSFGT